jgi:hypothetical protein
MSVINIAARIESLSKDHFRAPIVYGPEINQLLALDIAKTDYKKLMEQAKNATTSEKAQLYHQEMTKINVKLLSSYLFEHRLKGVSYHAPIFRVSPSLFDFNKNYFWELIDCQHKKIKDNLINILAKRSIERPLNN